MSEPLPNAEIDAPVCPSCGHAKHEVDGCLEVVGYDHLNGDHECGCEGCICPHTDPSTWLSAASCGYGSGYEPGSMQEWDPDCPVHPPSPRCRIEDRACIDLLRCVDGTCVRVLPLPTRVTSPGSTLAEPGHGEGGGDRG